MNNRCLWLWTQFILKPFVAGYSNYVITLEDFSCRRQHSFLGTTKSFGTEIELVPGCYTCVLQPCDMSIWRSFKAGIKKQNIDWAASK